MKNNQDPRELAAALAVGKSCAQWASAHGVPVRTAQRWAGESEVRAEVETYRRGNLDQAVGRMSNRAVWATNEIAKLAREAEICYVTVAMVTDYDCWHPDHDAVTVSDIIANLMKNAENACRVVAEAVASMPAARGCQCGSALSHAILTDRQLVPAATRQKLGILIDKYFV